MAADTQQRGTEVNKIPTGLQPASPKPLSDSERRIAYAELRERARRSKLEVVAPPGKKAYWASRGDANEMSRLEYLDFEVVKDDPKAPKWKANGRREDGTYQIGDVILMSIDQDKWDVLEQDNLERANAAVSTAQETFLSEAEKSGTPTFTVRK